MIETTLINKTMDRDDLFKDEGPMVCEYLNNLIKEVYAEGCSISSWIGLLPDEKSALSSLEDSRNFFYEPLKGAVDDDRFPWFLYWETYWLWGNVTVSSGDKILDAGGASSLFSCFLASKDINVCAIELKEGLVVNANKIAESMEWKMESYVMNMNKLKFEDEEFDHVFSVCTFEHLDYEDKQKSLREIHRVLKPGGMLAITFDYKNPAPAIEGKGKDISPMNRISFPGDVRRQFFIPELYEVEGNQTFFDNGKKYLSHPLFKPSKGYPAYTFGSFFLRKKE